MEEMKYAFFGAGKYGMLALRELGKKNVVYFIDNNKEKQGTLVEGIPIISFEEYISNRRIEKLIITSRPAFWPEIRNQIEGQGIKDYQVYVPMQQYYYSPKELVHNPYIYRQEAADEETWNQQSFEDGNRKRINDYVEIFSEHVPMFNHVEIETYNRCNGGCDFCPVSVKNEIRPECKMSKDLFQKIIDDLHEMNYGGKLALFSNNEPFMDERIIDFHKYAREKLPNARMHLYTNGTLLPLADFIEIMKYLDELIIDNYNQELQLIPNNRAIKEYCEEHPELIERVTIVLRKPREILSSRGGDAPNRKEKIVYTNDKCMLPFRQMIIRPDGKVSLCCNDPLGKNTMGDLAKESLLDVWYGSKFTKVRELVAKGRQYWPHCMYCDSFIVG